MRGIGLRGRKEDWIKEIGFVARAQIGRGFFAYNTGTSGALKTAVTRLLFWVANRNEGDVASSVTRNCALNVLKNAWRLSEGKTTQSVVTQNDANPRPTRFHLYGVEYN
jgi:hypothetical protein